MRPTIEQLDERINPVSVGYGGGRLLGSFFARPTSTTPTAAKVEASIDSQGKLTINGTSKKDVISVRQDGNEMFVSAFTRMRGVTDPEVFTWKFEDVTSVSVFAGQGNDKMGFIDLAVPLSANGGTGNDQFFMELSPVVISVAVTPTP